MHFFVLFFLSGYLSSLTPSSPPPPVKPGDVSSGEWQKENGLKADYFNGTNFEKKVFTRREDEINFTFLGNSPAPGVHKENYSIRWTGSLYAPVSGTYKLFVRVDDGVRLWVNGVKVLDKWQLQEVTTYGGQLELKEGEFYSLKIEYYNGPLHGVMQLLWESPEDKTSSFFGLFEDTPRKVIPNKYLFTSPPKKEPIPALPEPDKEEEEAVVAKKNPRESQKKEKPAGIERTSAMPVKTKAPERTDSTPFKDLKAGEVVQFKKVWFEQGKYVLLEGSHSELDKLAEIMKRRQSLKIRIEGHTDNVGDPGLNQSLSLFRAKVVATYLLDKGIDAARLEAVGFGDRRPVADNSTEEGRAKNRRVEFVVK